MALSPTVLASLIETNLKINIPEMATMTDPENVHLTKVLKSISDSIIQHIQTNAQVTVIVTGTSPTGPVTGTGIGLPGTAIL